MTKERSAVLYRMVLPDHICPYGVRAKETLEEAGYQVEDHILRTRAEVDDFQAGNNVATTPQIFIDGKRIGGSSDLESILEHSYPTDGTSGLDGRPVGGAG